MKIKTSELIGPALRWAVATLEGYTNLRRGVFSGELVMDPPRKEYGAVEFSSICYDTDWSQGGQIIDLEGILLRPIRKPGHEMHGQCLAMYDENNTDTIVRWVKRTDWPRHYLSGPTPLIAAMRCYVARKLGDEVNIPEELL